MRPCGAWKGDGTMGKKLLQTHSSYRIVLLALCLLIALIVALFVYTSSWTSARLRENIVDTMMENVSFLRTDFTDSVRETEKAMNYLLRSSEVTSFFTFSKTYTQAEYYTSLSRLRKLLSLMCSSNSFLNSYVIHYPGLELSMDAEKGIMPYDGDKLMNVLETIRQNHTHLVYDPDDGSFCLYYASSQEAPVYVLQAIISREQIQDTLSTFSQEKDKYSLLYFSEDQTLLYSGNAGFSLAPVAEALSGENGERIQKNLLLGGKAYILIGNHSPALRLTWAQLYPISRIQASNQAIARVTILSICIMLLFALAYVCILQNSTYKPVNTLLRGFRSVSGGDFSTRVQLDSPQEYQELANGFNSMVNKIETLIQTTYLQTIRLQQAELKQLQTQINPHFLYNCFFMLRHMLGAQDEDTIREAFQYMEDFYAYITRVDDGKVYLRSEYKHAMDYLHIQKLRFSTLKLRGDPLPEEIENTLVPSLILQPIIENTFQHAFANRAGEKEIRLHFRIADCSSIDIVIADNGSSLSDEDIAALDRKINQADVPISETHGLTNINKRLQLLSQGRCCLNLSRSIELGGLEVCLQIRG